MGLEIMKLYDVPQINGQLYLRDSSDLWGFLQNGEYEPEETELIKKLVKPDDICIDGGANIGYFTILMAKQSKYVMSFEPEPSNRELLQKNLEVNKIINVFNDYFALAEFTGDTYLYLCDKSHGMHRIFRSKHCDKSIMINAVKFDDIWAITHREINFVKLDLEGSELGALKGMITMLGECKPTILAEFHPPSIQEYGANPKQIYDLLTELKYDIRLVPKIDESISYEDLYAATNNESGGQNILCEKK